MTCAEIRADLGAYVVRALPPERMAAIRDHLVVCPGCRREYEELAMVPDYLGLLTPEEAEEGPPQADPAMLDRLLAAVSAQRRRGRRRRLLLVSAAAAAVIAIAAFAGVALWGGGEETPGRPAQVVQVSAQAPDSAAHAAVVLRSKAWGTAMTLTLSGVSSGNQCELVAVSSTGARQTAASWTVPSGGYDPERPLVVNGAVGIQIDKLAKLEVVTLSGQHLVTVPV